MQPPAVTRLEGADALAAPEQVPSDGEFDAGMVVARIRAESRRIARCYESELARDPTLQGVLRVEFVILTSGQVARVNVTENTVSPALGSCVSAIIASLSFSPGPVGGSVQYRFPFVFELAGSRPR